MDLLREVKKEKMKRKEMRKGKEDKKGRCNSIPCRSVTYCTYCTQTSHTRHTHHILHCTVLYYTALYYTALDNTVLYCTTQNTTLPYCSVTYLLCGCLQHGVLPGHLVGGYGQRGGVSKAADHVKVRHACVEG
jgi:hypothetical protein